MITKSVVLKNMKIETCGTNQISSQVTCPYAITSFYESYNQNKKELINFITSNTTSELSFSVLIDEFQMEKDHELCNEAKRSLSIKNAGGSSELSEAYSIHYFNKMSNNIKNFILEMEARYDFYNSSICDFLINFGTHRVGVSVTRAYDYHSNIDNAHGLLRKKLFGLIVARSGISENDGFDKCILHVWCKNIEIAFMIRRAYDEIIKTVESDDGIRDVVIILTVCDDNKIY